LTDYSDVEITQVIFYDALAITGVQINRPSVRNDDWEIFKSIWQRGAMNKIKRLVRFPDPFLM
jgi:hypothetical protein